jgi:hypothetical protein
VERPPAPLREGAARGAPRESRTVCGVRSSEPRTRWSLGGVPFLRTCMGGNERSPPRTMVVRISLTRSLSATWLGTPCSTDVAPNAELGRYVERAAQAALRVVVSMRQSPLELDACEPADELGAIILFHAAMV